MPTCNHCGSHVSKRFARVFGHEGEEINACPSCSANAGIAEEAKDRSSKS